MVVPSERRAKAALVFPPIFTDSEEYHASLMKYMEDYYKLYPPLTLAYIAAVLEQDDVSCRIIDALALEMTDREISEQLLLFSPDVVVLSLGDMCRGVFMSDLLRTARLAKRTLPDGTVLAIDNGSAFGIETTDTWKQVMKHNASVDVAVVGQGVNVLTVVRDVVKAIENAQGFDEVRGVLFRADGEIKETEGRKLIPDLDSFPYPARHLLPPLRLYTPPPTEYKRTPVIHMAASYGCPFKCTFCAAGSFPYRTRGVEGVIREIKHVVDEYGAKEIRFVDSSFTVNLKWASEFCDALIEEGIDITWSCLNRVDLVTPELLKKMAKAGCWNIYFGIESGSQRLLDRVKKGFSLRQADEAIKWCKEAGIETTTSFMFGLPGETPEMAEETIQFAKHLNPNYAVFHCTYVLPGTELNETTEQMRERSDMGPKISVPSGYSSSDEILKIRRRAYREFYLRPSYLVGRLRSITSMSDIARFSKAFSTLMRVAVL